MDSDQLPPGWKTAIHPSSNRRYYYNREKGETVWDIDEVHKRGNVNLPNTPIADRDHSVDHMSDRGTDSFRLPAIQVCVAI
ncbi:hypothetical protein KIPB_011793 [Kipferlia bialata]|uniref:WW domain-containing protein n=1 Tax=Kipferlia bialata TaxID=797122 RepID=A0A9K3GNH4_9EUKA|nr:hypothetical protein KIPB_011793 [Kipferlia bialata]|eukprot:g11793.t1